MFISPTQYGRFMASCNEQRYIGGELPLFSLATNWKRYLKAALQGFLIGDVLEVGSGIGGTTVALHDGTARWWVCLEPDIQNVRELQSVLIQGSHQNHTAVIAGSLRALAQRPFFDCVLYIDVLEHIEDDQSEIEAAAGLVKSGGYIVVISPAHQWLFSEFDRSIGHLRRYNKRTLRSLIPSGWTEYTMVYLDSVGFFLSLANLLALKQAMPSNRQIYVWDRVCVPFSRLLDSLSFGTFGKSILTVWRKPQ